MQGLWVDSALALNPKPLQSFKHYKWCTELVVQGLWIDSAPEWAVVQLHGSADGPPPF